MNHPIAHPTTTNRQANRALCYRLMLIQQGAGASGATCNDFINHPPPPDVF